MVFTHLDETDKHAFFDLLDEYFASRPEIFGDASHSSDGAKPIILPSNANTNATAQSHAVSAVSRALASNPEATASLISSGLRHSANANANAGGAKSPHSGVLAAASNPEVANSVGRVAAAAFAFNQNKTPPAPSPAPSSGKPAPPPPTAPAAPTLPHRSPSTLSARSTSISPPTPSPPHSQPPPPSIPSSGPYHKKPPPAPLAGLTSQKSLGPIDTSSFSRSLITAATKAKPPTAAPPQKPAFPKKTGGFAPPPVRSSRVPSGDAPPLPRRAVEPEPEEEEEEEVIWAEALYDYDSGESGDLPLRAKQHVRITEKDSADWWTGEVDGKTGLFPAAYVKLL